MFQRRHRQLRTPVARAVDIPLQEEITRIENRNCIIIDPVRKLLFNTKKKEIIKTSAKYTGCGRQYYFYYYSVDIPSYWRFFFRT